MRSWLPLVGVLVGFGLTAGGYALLHDKVPGPEGLSVSQPAEDGPVLRAIELVQGQCEKEWANFAQEHEADWVDGAANLYCLCATSMLLLTDNDDSAEDVVEKAQALIAEREVFRSFIRLEPIFNQCVPEAQDESI